MRTICLVIITFYVTNIAAQDQSAEQIQNLLFTQERAWNQGDLSAFMQTYVNHNNLQFLSKEGLITGWDATFDRYTKTYPNTTAMGQLKFETLDITKRDRKVYTVIGKYHLDREGQSDKDGYFMLVVQKINRKWFIVADSTH